MKRFLFAVALAAISIGVNAEQTTKPIRYTWIATSCENWNCAAAALVLANGDKHVIVLPTGQNEVPWVILRRVEEGSLYIPDEEPFRCEVFTTSAEASAHFDGMEACRGAMLMSVPDGRLVVTALQKCDGLSKRRAVR